MSIENTLSAMPTARLVKIVLAALEKMSEVEQIEFIARYIDAKTSLQRSGADDSVSFLEELEKFCRNCLDNVYYTDEQEIEDFFIDNDHRRSYYDDGWDYGEYFETTEWSKNFTRLFKLSMMYIQSGDIKTGYEANAKLLSCLQEASVNDCFGMGDCDLNPEEFIEVDWSELFELHYSALFQYNLNLSAAIDEAFRLWIDYGERCTEGFLTHVKDIDLAENCILNEIKNAQDNWTFQCLCFKLLEKLYARLGENFDKVSHAKALINFNVFFYLIATEGYHEQAQWPEVVETALAALDQIPFSGYNRNSGYSSFGQNKIRASIQAKLTEAYESLGDNAKAFETAKTMFWEAPDFALYKRARGLAEKTTGAPEFLAAVEAQLGEKQTENIYGRASLLLYIYSYEGEIEKLVGIAHSQKINQNYYDKKYIALSLVYRAMNGAEETTQAIGEYLSRAVNQNGIEDMLILSGDAETRAKMLSYASVLLTEMVAFHIDAASRSRYAKAAYYMCVLRDICEYLGKKDEFMDYFKDVIAQNNRRPALRDEMSVVYGKSAVGIKR
ncbi:MAG: hypothetical protein FWD23_11020 [Oscillospiraceae bacterium]|nr:hypothetical protein [Oscillospiraceae bacterium]